MEQSLTYNFTRCLSFMLITRPCLQLIVRGLSYDHCHIIKFDMMLTIVVSCTLSTTSGADNKDQDVQDSNDIHRCRSEIGGSAVMHKRLNAERGNGQY